MSTENKNIISDWKVFKRIVGLAMNDRFFLFFAIFLACLLAFLGPLKPFLVEYSVDQYILTYDGKGLVWMSTLLLILLLVDFLVRYVFSYLTSWLGQRVVYRLRRRVFSHILSLKMRFFDTTPIGTSVTRTLSDVETVNDIFSEGMINIVADLLTIVFILIFMFYQNWKISIVACITFPFMFYATYWFKESVKKNFQEVRNAIARLNSFLQEHITGMSVIQSFHAEDQEYQKFEKINQVYRDENIKTIWAYSVFFPVVEIILSVAIGLTVWYGSLKVIALEANPGTIISFIMYVNMLFRPLRVLADTFNTLQMGMVAAERVFKLLDTDEKIENNGTLKPENIKGEVRFENVKFAYDEKNLVLKGVDFTADAGQVLAIVGSTGSGKTSIINTLTRNYEIQSGVIRIDGIDIRDIELQFLQKHIGIVLQDVFLFNATILDNITLFDKNISRSKVIATAKEIGAHVFIERLPGGYDYTVLERGNTLSMGQRQIISFLRCLIYDPKILILDEASSSIDTESEIMIQQAIDKMIINRTSIIIAHRLSTIQHAKKILVMDQGHIVESGTQRELIEKDGYYARLYEIQFQKKDENITS